MAHNSIMVLHRISSVWFLLLIVLMGHFCQPVLGQEQSDLAKATKKYQIIIRVVRPTVRLPITKGKENRPEYMALQQGLFFLKDITSDMEFLKAVRKNNPFLYFDKVRNSKVLTLKENEVWEQLENFSMHKVTLQILTMVR